MNDTGQHDPVGPARDGGSGSVNIGSMSGGSIATGSHGSAISVNRTGAESDARHEELLRSVRELRAALTDREHHAEDIALDGELADVEAEIVRTGAVGQGRLVRLLTGVRGWLGTRAAAVGAVASATAVVQGVAQLLG
ncbi:hypothetical protein [Streptomyces fructofermentans]|uniref:hypothetical protein n=1 Tax=Streptomyces fructofermentans TaxID=152141 RepID=UPI0033E1E8AA